MNHPYLQEIKSTVYDIPARLKEIDPSLFLAYNAKEDRIEIHSTENKGNTFYMVAPFMDSRLIDLVKYNSYIRQQDLIRYLDAENEKAEQRMEREKKSWMQDVISETRWHFKQDKETLGL